MRLYLSATQSSTNDDFFFTNMLARLLRRTSVRLVSVRKLQQVPFQEDLTEVDDDYFNLDSFKHYKESPDVRAYRKKLGLSESEDLPTAVREEAETTFNPAHSPSVFTEVCKLREPVVFVSKLSNPYLNLAIEDYIYNQMPVPDAQNTNRLMFYTNSPCVVIGKNQNPWNEVNLPLLNSLRIPLVRRRSGGGTVVHDLGNVNYSFMTTKDKFDRHTFADLVARAVNKVAPNQDKHITVTERGDIVTKTESLKVSGSAYKLSKGKSYHHGTMLLNLNLEVLRQLLHRDPAKVGHVQSQAAIASVRSPVTNLNIENDVFIDSVVSEFKDAYGMVSEVAEAEKSEDEFDQTELLGLDGFVQAYSGRNCAVFNIDESTELPEEITKVRDELVLWEWKFGSTSKFNHTFTNESQDFQVTFFTEKKGLLKAFELVNATGEVEEQFQFLKFVLDRGDEIKYTGSDIAGFITDDAISDWIGESIDGST